MSDASSLNEPVLQEQVEKLNRQNTEHSHGKAEDDDQRGEDRGSGGRRQEPAELILDGPHTTAAQSEERKKATKEKEEEEGGVFEDSESEEEGKTEDVSPDRAGKVEDDGKNKHKGEAEELSKSEEAQSVIADICKTSLLPQERYFWHNLFLCYHCVSFLFLCLLFMSSHRSQIRANSSGEGEEK